MNKILTIAGIATLFLASCNNEETPNLIAPNEYATIELGISNDNEMISTRASDKSVSDLATWYGRVDGEANYTFETEQTADKIKGVSYSAAEHTIYVSNFMTEANAYTANGGAGAAYYQGTKTQTLFKGTNEVSIDCGKAKNARVAFTWSATDITGLVFTSVEATQLSPERSYTFTSNGTAYFYAGKEIVCTINYKFNSADKTITKTFSAPAAATEYELTITANSNGTITTLTINYDETFEVGTGQTVTIDAATGEEATTQPQS